MSASSPDSLEATNHNQSGDADSSGGHNNSGRSSRNYYYRKLQSNESPSRRRVVRHRARRNVPGSLASSSNENESGGGVPNGSIRSNTGSHASHLSKSSPSLDHAAAAAATAAGGGSGSRSSSMSNNSPTRMEKRHQRTRNAFEESFGSRNGSPFHHHHLSCGSSKGRSASTEGRVNSGHISLDPRLHGGQDAAVTAGGGPPLPAAVPNPDYSPIMVRRRYYQDRIMLDRDASNFKYEDDKIKVRKNQIRLKSTTLQSPSQPPPAPPPANLWGNAQRYKGSLENMLEAEQQQSSSRSRAGMLVKDFLSRNSRRRRRGRMLSLPSRYVD